MEFIDLFCGAGGLSLGLEGAGLRCVAAVEIDRDSCATFAARHRDALIFDESIEGVDFRQFEGIDLIAGGPPCQPFSSGGKGLASQDERDMLPAFIRAVREAMPKAFLMENVPGLISPSHRAYLDATIAEFSDIGYTVEHAVLNAATFGVPQKRRRLFISGLRGDVAPVVFPTPTHGPGSRRPYVSTGSVLVRDGVIGEPNESKVVYAKNPDLRPSPFDGHLFNGGGRPIDLSSPAHTILASAGGNKTHFIDVLGEVPEYHRSLMAGGSPRTGTLTGGRRLTVAESAAIQTFPKGMQFHGSRSSQYTQVGNAVPPDLAKVLGKALLKQIQRVKDVHAPVTSVSTSERSESVLTK